MVASGRSEPRVKSVSWEAGKFKPGRTLPRPDYHFVLRPSEDLAVCLWAMVVFSIASIGALIKF